MGKRIIRDPLRALKRFMVPRRNHPIQDHFTRLTSFLGGGVGEQRIFPVRPTPRDAPHEGAAQLLGRRDMDREGVRRRLRHTGSITYRTASPPCCLLQTPTGRVPRWVARNPSDGSVSSL